MSSDFLSLLGSWGCIGNNMEKIWSFNSMFSNFWCWSRCSLLGIWDLGIKSLNSWSAAILPALFLLGCMCVNVVQWFWVQGSSLLVFYTVHGYSFMWGCLMQEPLIAMHLCNFSFYERSEESRLFRAHVVLLIGESYALAGGRKDQLSLAWGVPVA